MILLENVLRQEGIFGSEHFLMALVIIIAASFLIGAAFFLYAKQRGGNAVRELLVEAMLEARLLKPDAALEEIERQLAEVTIKLNSAEVEHSVEQSVVRETRSGISDELTQAAEQLQRHREHKEALDTKRNNYIQERRSKAEIQTKKFIDEILPSTLASSDKTASFLLDLVAIVFISSIACVLGLLQIVGGEAVMSLLGSVLGYVFGKVAANKSSRT